MMNRPVTRTAASEARNSTVVSRGFSSCCSSCLSFLANGSFSITGGIPPLFDDSKCAVPAGHLKQMGRCISEMIKFITRCGRERHILIGAPD